MAVQKTNAMRILDKGKISYNIYSYDTADGKLDGISVAEKIGRSPSEVYKTLVTKGSSNQIYVFVIPVDSELSLKKAAAAVGEKSIEMLKSEDLLKNTGYIRGGCSPIGMKKQYKTVIDFSAKGLPQIIVSAGKIGSQVEICPQALEELISASFEEIIHF